MGLPPPKKVAAVAMFQGSLSARTFGLQPMASPLHIASPANWSLD